MSMIMCTFADMKTKNNTLSSTQPQEAFREKVSHYLVCFIESCPLREQCLRWLVGQYADTMPLAYNAINPRNPKIGGEECVMFRKEQRVVMKRGLTHLYLEMPGLVEHRVRRMLIGMWGHKKYYEVRKGDRLITPEMQNDVETVCRYHGWKGPIVYDGEEESWLW
ncbi:hypothetical protein SAMN04487827_1543 [Prevotella sp. khp7]|nr:hypothetical protein SAMN04487827_1543 [Prevotella sp. khp7]